MESPDNNTVRLRPLHDESASDFDTDEIVNLIEVLELLELSAILSFPPATSTSPSTNSNLFKGGHTRRRQMDMVVQLTDAEERLENSVRQP
jgi:hypothetical protein